MDEILFLHSPNCKFFAGCDQVNFFLYRDKNLVWRKKLPQPGSTLIDVANNGLVLVQAPEGLLPYHVSGEDPLLPIEPYRTGILEKQAAKLGKILLEESGTGIIIEKIAERSKISESLFGFLKKGKEESGQGNLLREIIRYNFASESEESIWRTVTDKEKGDFHWASNRDLSFLVVAEEKTKSKMLLIEPRAGKILYEVSLADTRIIELILNYSGTVVAGLKTQNEMQYLGINLKGEKFLITPPAANVRLIHAGNRFLLFEEENQILHLKGFDDRPLFSMDMKILSEIHSNYHLFFKDNDDPVLVCSEPGSEGRNLRLIYTSLDNLEIQYKSWQFEAKQAKEISAAKKGAEEKSQTEKAKNDILQTIPFEVETDAKHEAKHDVKRDAKQPNAAPASSVDSPKASAAQQKIEILKQLEHLKLQMTTAAISAEEGKRKKEELERQLIEAEGKSEKPSDAPQEPSPERKRIKNLIDKLEERFINGEMSEKTYHELKEKYEQKLKESQ